MDGTAARVLDYAAIWVHDDGSSEMLEHEIQKIQSQEAINAESETEPPDGAGAATCASSSRTDGCSSPSPSQASPR